jgi:hypothetical protein
MHRCEQGETFSILKSLRELWEQVSEMLDVLKDVGKMALENKRRLDELTKDRG